MSFVESNDGTRIHYRAEGRRRGEPVLLIQGLGVDGRGWLPQRLALWSRYRVITIDNRGTGRSDKPVGPYDLEQLARDAIAVLDAEDIDRAHIVGASMGGIIAQIIAVRHPERVRSLVLSCTGCHHQAWRRELLEEWSALAQAQGMRRFARANLRWLVGPRSLRRFAPALGVLGPLAMSAPTHAFVAQVNAILDMDDNLRTLLPTIDAPTLVIVGSQDILTPQGDSEEIAELIPDAELAVVQGGSHGLMFESFATFNRLLLEFLARATANDDDELLGIAAASTPV